MTAADPGNEHVLGELKVHAQQGVCSEIVYASLVGQPESTVRLIEPTAWLSGFAYHLVRAVQHSPQVGVRLFDPSLISEARPAAAKRTRDASAFLAGAQSAPEGRQASSRAMGAYIQSVRQALTDYSVTPEEVAAIEARREELEISLSEMRAAHSIVFGEVLHSLSCDLYLDASEEELIERSLRCLDELGWAPQT